MATPGEAHTAVNLRQNDGSLVVVGQPTTRYHITHGHRLLLADGDHVFTLCDTTIYCNGIAVTTTGHDVVAMHRVGEGLVIVTSGGLIHLRYNGDDCVVVNTGDAVPAISLVAADAFTVQESLDALSFRTPYDAWRAPLAAADVDVLTSHYRAAWKLATSAISSQGAFHTPLMACYGVRLWDESYLYFSSPVVLGRSTLDNARQATARVTTASAHYTGIEATSLSLQAYRLGIVVAGGVSDLWLGMIKAIDVFVTSQPAIALTQSLDYRCVSTMGGVRVPGLQYGWTAVPEARVMAQLEASGWHLVATTGDIGALAQGRFVAPNVAYVGGSNVGCTMVSAGLGEVTREQVAAVMQGVSMLAPVASMVRNGRLYLASARGELSCSAHGNALSSSLPKLVTGARVLALAPVARPIYSGGFGRYAVYLFTSEGIYAVAQSATGTLGEARLVDRSIIAQGCVPIEGNRDIYFVDQHHRLCRLEGNVVYHLLSGVEVVGGMAWDDAHGELVLLNNTGRVLAISPQGFYSERTIDAVALCGSGYVALAVTASGEVLDLNCEQPASLSVSYVSHPIVVGLHSPVAPCGVMWWIEGNGVALALQARGAQGDMQHSFLLCRFVASGSLCSPLSMPLVAPPCRAISLAISGTAHTGTIFHPLSLKYTVL